MTLRAKKPEPIQKRLKLFVYGAAGVGKTTAAIQFPSAYLIDTERGADPYTKTINKSRSVVFASNNFDEVSKEVKELLTTKHDYRTLIIDPVTQLYNSVQEKWTRVFEKHAKNEKEAEVQDFGMRYWGRVKSDFKTLQRMLVSIDMNLIVTAHQKDLYGTGMSKIGVTFDSMKGEDYLYDLVFRLENRGSKRVAVTVKERAEIGEAKFPPEFEWSYENFCNFYGTDIIQRESVPIRLATPEQTAKVKALLDVVRVSNEEVIAWFTKADVDAWEEMTNDTIGKIIDYLEKKVGSLSHGSLTQESSIQTKRVNDSRVNDPKGK
ncbi:MAG TPA: AAA family ATPase [Patescibacteria group bacterium]